MHISGSENISTNASKWKLEQSNIKITKDTDGCYFANFDVEHFSGFQLTYDKEIEEESYGADHEYSIPEFVKSQVESFLGRCQTFMTNETKDLNNHVNFGITVYVYPFQYKLKPKHPIKSCTLSEYLV